MNIANKARRILVDFGKTLPFLLCSLCALYYIESFTSLVFANYFRFYNYTMVNAPISYYIGQFFEYDWLVVIVASIISIAIETCVWNRLAILYLALHLVLKDIITFEVEVWQAYIIIIANLIVSLLLTLKGINIRYRNLRCIAR